MTEVLTVGMAVADIVMQVDNLPTSAEKYRANTALITLGGCAANAAVAVNRLGGTGRLAARLGRDPIGDLIISALSAEGVDSSLCDRGDGARSSFSAIHVDAAGERQITNYRGNGLAETLDLSAAKPAAVLADNRSADLLAAAFTVAQTSGAPIVIDAEAPFDPETVRGATHIAFSMQGLRDYASDSSIETALLFALAARSAASFARFARSAPAKPGVNFAMCARSTLSSILIFWE